MKKKRNMLIQNLRKKQMKIKNIFYKYILMEVTQFR